MSLFLNMAFLSAGTDKRCDLEAWVELTRISAGIEEGALLKAEGRVRARGSISFYTFLYVLVTFSTD